MSKIAINPTMIIDSPSNSQPELLFDGKIDTFWFPGWDLSNYPASVTIDLQQQYDIDHIRIYDGTGKPTIRLSVGLNAPTELATNPVEISLDKYLVWTDIPIQVSGRFITLSLLEMTGNMPIGLMEVHTTSSLSSELTTYTALNISSDMIIEAPENSQPELLFDGQLDTFWFPGWQQMNYPAKVVVDLKANYTITSLEVYDGTGRPRVNFSLAKPTPADVFVAHQLILEKYLKWHTIPVSGVARYLIIELLDMKGDKPIGLVKLFGELADNIEHSEEETNETITEEEVISDPTTDDTAITIPSLPTTASKIDIQSSMVVPLSADIGNPFTLFNENTDDFWFPGWNAQSYPAKIAINLQKRCQINYVRLFDGTGEPQIKLSFANTDIDDIVGDSIVEKLDGYMSWKLIEVNVVAKYVLFEINEPKSDKPVSALEVYTEDNTEETDEITINIPDVIPDDDTSTVPLQINTVKNRMGVNSFHWVPLEVTGEFNWIREYQYWTWMEATEGQYRFEPAAGANANYDTHYAELKANGIRPIACINTTPEWLKDYPNGMDWNFDHKPKPYGSDGTNPQSYKALAKFVFQLAARYGKTSVETTLLEVDLSTNTKKTGLDLLEYIEIWNEPDKWWKGEAARFSPFEYAAMLSACYDGHEGTLGEGCGAKQADPSMKVIMAGLTKLDTNYILDMDQWFRTNRSDGLFCSEALNFHHYSNSSPSLEFSGFEAGISPEADNLRERLESIVAFRNTYFPTKEVWLSEFGYDSQISPQSAPYIGTATSEEIQSAWLARAFLESIAANADGIFLYNMIDVNASVGLYQTSGLTQSEPNQYIKKPSWYAIMDLLTNMEDMYFKIDVSPNTEVKAYVFENSDSSQRITYAWLSSTENKVKIVEVNGIEVQLTEFPKVI